MSYRLNHSLRGLNDETKVKEITASRENSKTKKVSEGLLTRSKRVASWGNRRKFGVEGIFPTDHKVRINGKEIDG